MGWHKMESDVHGEIENGNVINKGEQKDRAKRVLP